MIFRSIKWLPTQANTPSPFPLALPLAVSYHDSPRHVMLTYLDYLLRVELIALHGASSYPGAQFYVSAEFRDGDVG